MFWLHMYYGAPNLQDLEICPEFSHNLKKAKK